MNDNIFEKKLRVVFYARVSTEKYEQQSSLENQISYYKDLITSNKNWEFCGGYIDEGISGTSTKARVKFLEMIENAKKGEFDLIITKEISRFSRNTLDSIKYTRMLLKSNVGVYFESDNINTLSSDSELRLTIMSAIAQDEVRKISERIKFGCRQSIKDGKVLGTGSLIGYIKKDGKLIIDEKTAFIVKKIFELYVYDKIGIRKISQKLCESGILNSNDNPYTFSTIKNILTNPKYKGFYCGKKYENIDIRYGKKTKLPKKDWILKTDENIPAIISEELWDMANDILTKRSIKFSPAENNKAGSRYAYSSKIICKYHNTIFHRNVYNKSTEVWNCSVYKQNGKESCDNFAVYTSEINAILISIFNNNFDKTYIINTLLNFYNKINSPKNDVDDAKSKKENLKKKKNKLLSLLLDEVISDEEYKMQSKKIENTILELEKTSTKLTKKPMYKENLKSIFDNLDENILTQILDKIYIKRENDTMDMEILLTNNECYFAKYKKRGRKFLSKPILEKQEI